MSTAAFLAQAARWFARQGITWRALMTDNGSGYRSHRFQALRRQLRIRHVWTRPYRPQTNGKAERFIRTSLAQWAYAAAYQSSRQRALMLPEWLRYYNRARPHTALGFRPPSATLGRATVNNVFTNFIYAPAIRPDSRVPIGGRAAQPSQVHST